MENILSQPGDLRSMAGSLIDRANEHGGLDNITALLVRFEKGGEDA